MIRCDFKLGAGTRCGTTLVLRTDAIGRVTATCHVCERRKAGVCRCCRSPVSGQRGKAIYCDVHRELAKKARCARWYSRDIEHARSVRRAAQARIAAKRKEGQPQLTAREHAANRGYARAAALTPERRQEIGRKAITARWAKAKAAQVAA